MMGIGFPQFSSPLFFTLRTFGLALVRLSSVGFCFVIWGFEGGGCYTSFRSSIRLQGERTLPMA